MSESGTYEIDLKGLADGVTLREYDLDDGFFAALDGALLEHGALHVTVTVRRTGGLFELLFHTVGSVTVACDLCLDDVRQPVSTDNRLLVRLGAEADTDGDELVTVKENPGVLDLSWFIYEFIVLAVPVRHVHAPGECNRAMTERLDGLSAARSGGEAGAADERWSALERLKTKKM